MKYSFPAIFRQDEYEPELYNVFFPDFLGASTFGEGIEETCEMAKDLLLLLLKDEAAKHTKATCINDLQHESDVVLMVEVEV